MAISANGRYAIPAAPAELELAHEFLNTWPHAGTGGPDLLADEALASEWFDYAGTLVEIGGRPPNQLRELAELRGVRDTLRGALLRDGRIPSRRIARNLRVEIAADGVMTVEPIGSPADRLIGSVFAQLLLAQSTGTMRRLKICANPVCLGAFYDRSPNVSKVWHDAATCGNQINLRASRARRRTSQ